MPNPDRRAFFTYTATAAAAGVAAVAGMPVDPVRAATATPTPSEDQRKFMAEATRLAIELVEKGWGGPFGAVIVKDGQIIGRGQNRVLLTGCPVHHAEVTAIMDASAKLNPKGLLGTDYSSGTMLEMIPREAGSPDPVPMRARMLKGCDIYINERRARCAWAPSIGRALIGCSSATALRIRAQSVSTMPFSTKTSRSHGESGGYR